MSGDRERLQQIVELQDMLSEARAEADRLRAEAEQMCVHVEEVEADRESLSRQVDCLRVTLADVSEKSQYLLDFLVGNGILDSGVFNPPTARDLAFYMGALSDVLIAADPVSLADDAATEPPVELEVRDDAASPVSLADVREVPKCVNCGHPIRRNAGSSTGWEHYPDPPDPREGWQGIRCPGRLTGAEAVPDRD